MTRQTMRQPSRRERRVILFVCLTLVGGLADMVLTVWCVQTFGLLEANPVARAAFNVAGSVWGLIVLKIAALLFASVVLCIARRRPSAEIVAVIGCLTHAYVMIAWVCYASAASDVCPNDFRDVAEQEGSWLVASADVAR